ncbi:MAG: hypothetical protein AVDCRST_MAG93-1019 [uncultured Chloroflexia bacterium]|uniref:Uncharacterized protein n=1 Tax=uncultured Chloroflexia bacterium TaxID=1672391 RepID=A0A6J4HUP1_9CHLR|nr:MAG: hypothetical protein AVDCRST_MAG93-1019 [uncultured Chloroflexia bacterium]
MDDSGQARLSSRSADARDVDRAEDAMMAQNGSKAFPNNNNVFGSIHENVVIMESLIDEHTRQHQCRNLGKEDNV